MEPVRGGEFWPIDLSSTRRGEEIRRRALTPQTLRAATLHSYTTAFLWATLIFVVGAVVARLVLKKAI
jgi:hypothetical protein